MKDFNELFKSEKNKSLVEEEDVDLKKKKTAKGLSVPKKNPERRIPGDRPDIIRNKDYTKRFPITKKGEYTMGEHQSKAARRTAAAIAKKPGGVGKAPRNPGVTTKPKIMKADNSPDVDVDPGFTGIMGNGGQEAMRVQPNEKCNGCAHYMSNDVACSKGLVPSVCGDGSYPELGYSPVTPNPIAAKNWATLNADKVVTSSSVDAGKGEAMQEIPYRIEVLGDSALHLSERITLTKAAYRADAIEELPFPVLPEREVDLGKSNMNIEEFADAMGSTVDVVRSLAMKLGNKEDFAKFIKSKLPDIRMAHGLTEAQIGELYQSAHKSLYNLTEPQWATWKGLTFETGVGDAEISTAIEQHGLLDANMLQHSQTRKSVDATSALPDPEPVQDNSQKPVAPFVGGNLHLANDLSRYGK